MSQPQSAGPGPAKDAGVSVLTYPLGTIGALVGAALGVLVMKLAMQSGFYAEIAIGLLTGLGAGLLGRRGGWPMGIIAGLVTLVVGVWAEWKFFPVWADDSLGFFVAHLTELAHFKLLVHVVGVGVAVWFGGAEVRREDTCMVRSDKLTDTAKEEQQSHSSRKKPRYLLGLMGTILGAAVGTALMAFAYWISFYPLPSQTGFLMDMVRANFYAGACVGIGAGVGTALLGCGGGWMMGITAALLTVVAGLWAEWKFGGPFIADDSLQYFVVHAFQLPFSKLLAHALGIAAAVWFGARK